jgi:hypothetical protein
MWMCACMYVRTYVWYRLTWLLQCTLANVDVCMYVRTCVCMVSRNVTYSRVRRFQNCSQGCRGPTFAQSMSVHHKLHVCVYECVYVWMFMCVRLIFIDGSMARAECPSVSADLHVCIRVFVFMCLRWHFTAWVYDTCWVCVYPWQFACVHVCVCACVSDFLFVSQEGFSQCLSVYNELDVCICICVCLRSTHE